MTNTPGSDPGICGETPMAKGSVRNRGKGGRELARTLLAFGFWASMIALLTSLLLGADPSARLARRLDAGIQRDRDGNPRLAEEEFLAVANGGDSLLAGLAYHNLGVLSLRGAMADAGPDGEEAARQAIAHNEASLALAPGTQETARNLELALRRLAESEDRPPPSSESPSEQQSGREGADTENEALGPSNDDGQNGKEPGHGLSEEAARRLLASFRTMERDGILDVIRARLRSRGTGTATQRRGPPW